MLKGVAAEAKKVDAAIPEALRVKTRELRSTQRRVANLVDFVADGRGSDAIRDELARLEARVRCLEKEFAGLRGASNHAVRAPTLAWLRKQIEQCREILEAKPAKSAGLLRRLLGPIRLDPVAPETGRPYYVAHTAVDSLALLADPESDDESDSGAKSLRWWTRQQRLRTLAALPVQVELRVEPVVPVYQRIAAEAAGMRARGLSVAAVARHFGVDDHTVVKAVRWLHGEL